jgi:hypothetical protein
VTTDEDESDANVYPDRLGEEFDSSRTFEQRGPSSKPHLIAQAILNTFVRDLNLSKRLPGILNSRLKMEFL